MLVLTWGLDITFWQTANTTCHSIKLGEAFSYHSQWIVKQLAIEVDNSARRQHTSAPQFTRTTLSSIQVTAPELGFGLIPVTFVKNFSIDFKYCKSHWQKQGRTHVPPTLVLQTTLIVAPLFQDPTSEPWHGIWYILFWLFWPWSLQSLGVFRSALSDRSICGSLGVAAVIAKGNNVARTTEVNFIMEGCLWNVKWMWVFRTVYQKGRLNLVLCQLVVVACGIYILQNFAKAGLV